MKKRLLFLFSLPLIIFMVLATLACPIVGLGERIDLKNPECQFTSFGNEEKLVSGSYVSGIVTLMGKCSDDIGVTEVFISVGKEENIAVATLSESKKEWSYEFDTTTQVDGEIEIFVKAKDAYGREGKNNTLLIIDNTAPIIVVDNAQGYGAPASDTKISIKGEAADNYRIKSVEISTDSTNLKVISLLGTFSWSASLNASFTGIYDLTITATDYAGNKSSVIFYSSEVISENGNKDLTADEIYRIYTLGSIESATLNKGELDILKKTKLPISVNLDDDIPRITLSSMQEGVVNPLGSGTLIIGRVRDDDAVNPNSLRIKFNAPFDSSDPNDGDFVPIGDITGFGQLISFATAIPLVYQNGQTHQLYITVKDTGNVQGFLGPIEFKINPGAPTVKVTSHTSGTAIKSSSVVLEGVISDDEEGINVECYNDEGSKIGTGVFTDVSDPKNKRFSITLTDLPENTNNLRVIGSDGEFTSSFNLTLNVDTQAPQVNVITPRKEVFVNGEVTIRGNFSDNYILKEGFYSIGKATGSPTPWKEITDMGNFSFEVATQEYEAPTFSISGGGVGNTVKILPIRFKVEDKAGNITETNDDFFYLRVDNQLDRPSIIILAPSNNAILGGSTSITGTSFDDEAVHSIFMRIDCNGDGLYNKKFDLSKNGNTNSNYDEIEKQGVVYKIAQESNPNEFFEDENLWYKLPGDVNPWRFTLNQRGEFYNVEGEHKGIIHIQVIAQDTKDGMVGDIFGEAKPLTITFDDTIPFIEGISPNPKNPVRKTITLHADFYDRKTGESTSEGIKNVEISYNNGINWTSLNDNAALTSVPGTGQYTNYDHRELNLTIDTTDTSTYPITNGQMFIKLKVVDLADYVSILPITYNIDNTFPEAVVATTNLNDQIGTEVKIQGTATDAGQISGISSVHLYFTNIAEASFIKPNDGSITTSATGKTKLLKQGSGSESQLIYPDDESYLIKIDSFTENGMDAQAGIGDNDGYPESLSLDGSTYHWWATFDSTRNFSDGAYKIHYVVFDSAGNGTHYSTTAFIKNNKPILSAFVVGTDINGDGTVATTLTPPIKELFDYSGDDSQLIVARNRKAYVQFQVTSNNNIRTIELLKEGTNILPESITGYAGLKAYTVQATIDTSNFTNGVAGTDPTSPIELTCKVVDNVGIPITQVVKMRIKNYSSEVPTITILKKADRFSMVENSSSALVKKLLTPDPTDTVWQYTLYGKEEILDTIQSLPKTAKPTVVGNLIENQLSGNMLFLAQAKDDQRIQEVYFVQDSVSTKILEINPATGILRSCHANCTIIEEHRLTQTLSQQEGHQVSFMFEWEAKGIDPVASISAGFKVVDFTGAGQMKTASDTYSISPYITEIQTELSQSHSNSSFFGRTVTGKYPVRDGETITIKGWNFGSNDKLKVNIGNSTQAHNLSGSDISVNISGIAGGKVELESQLTPSVSIKSKNGENSTKLQSKEPNLISNNLLYDNREIFVLKHNNLKPETTKQARYPRMKMLSNGNPIFSFADGSQYISTIDPTKYQIWETSYTQYYFSDIALATNKPDHYDTFEDAIVYTLNGDIATYFCGTARIIVFGHKSSGGSTEYYSPFTNSAPNGPIPSTYTHYKRMIESIYCEKVYVTERTPSPSLSVIGTENPRKAHIYLSYFDAAKSQIRYRYGMVTTTKKMNDPNYYSTYTLGFETDCSIRTNTTHEGSAPNYQVIAQKGEAGAYTSLAIHPDGTKAALFWYDSAAHSLKCKTTANAQVQEPVWGETIVIDSDYAGQYVNADFNGNQIGCAYYSSAKGDLRYAVLPNINATSGDETVYTVDSNLSVGTNVDLEYIGGKPYISYFNNSYISTSRSIKMAYEVTPGNGADSNELFTGNWEIYTIPCTSTPKNFTVSIGNQNGKPCVGFASDVALEYWTLN